MTINSQIQNQFVGQVLTYKLSFILDALIKNGIKKEQILQGTDITEAKLADPFFKVGREQIVCFYRNITALKISGISLLLGKSIRLNDYGLYGCTLLCCKDLQTTLEFSIRYHRLATKTVNFSLHKDDNKPYTCYRFDDLLFATDLLEFNITFQAAIVQTLIKECLGIDDFSFASLNLSFNQPNEHHLLKQHFNCPINYNQKNNEFVIHQKDLTLNTSRSNPFALPLLLNQCNTVLESIENKNEFLISINQWIASNMHNDISAEDLSVFLCLTPRTLRRKLAEQGVSFREILKELRCSAAKKLLIETQLTIEDIAYSIGFSDPSNFRAAFKKWTGHTPSLLRKNPAFTKQEPTFSE